jgi:hypothetical protein
MPSPDDRLQELRRQRALVQEQLAFLDREIASVSVAGRSAMPTAQSLPPGSAVPSQPSASAVPSQLATPLTEGGKVDEVIKSFEDETRANPAKAYWGCIWAFVAALALLGLCLFAFYRYVSVHQSPPGH